MSDLSPPEPSFVARLIDAAPIRVMAVDAGGVIRFANEDGEVHSGYTAADLVGTNILDYLHPEDVERALIDLAGTSTDLPFQGVTRYRIRLKDSTWAPIQATGATFESGGEVLAVVYARFLSLDLTVEEVIGRLTAEEPTETVLTRVLDYLPWQEWDARAAIAWSTGSVDRLASTMLPAELANGRDDGSPWDSCRRAADEQRWSAAMLDDERRGIAERAGLDELLVVPLDWGADDPALISIWTPVGGVRPEALFVALPEVRSVGELVLRWSGKSDQLVTSARTDPLTGLANRRVFFEKIAEGVGPGAVVYCDLDLFKPVNDTYGHPAGDIVLRTIADRLHDVVRSEDLVARLGGDEFALLCPGLSERGADALAARLSAVVEQPIDIGGRLVTVGISLGIEVTVDEIDADAVERADRALYAAKWESRGVDPPEARSEL